ncbi:MAG: hypothetical protein HC814_01020 [Rhodobacteraceae bacterium]|nr:hypothetical protein [Paracoccaceae bacterium]
MIPGNPPTGEATAPERPLVRVVEHHHARAGLTGESLEIQRALDRLKSSAIAGDPEAQFKLGALYANGQHVDQDYAEAARWFSLAAKQGHPAAQNSLGVCFANGQGVQGIRRTFRRFWEWSDAVEERAVLTSGLWTCFGWRVRVGAGANPRSLRNFPMQANGAEMLRLACCTATERGITAALIPVRTPGVEIAAMRHEVQSGRLFAN